MIVHLAVGTATGAGVAAVDCGAVEVPFCQSGTFLAVVAAHPMPSPSGVCRTLQSELTSAVEHVDSDAWDDVPLALESLFTRVGTRFPGQAPEGQALASAGATVAATVVMGAELFVAHAGDARIYLSRDGKLVQLTNDHTEAQAAVDRTEIRSHEAKEHPGRFELTRWLGAPDAESRFEVRPYPVKVQPGDRLFLVTRQVHDLIAEHEWTGLHRDYPDHDGALQAVIDYCQTEWTGSQQGAVAIVDIRDRHYAATAGAVEAQPDPTAPIVPGGYAFEEVTQEPEPLPPLPEMPDVTFPVIEPVHSPSIEESYGLPEEPVAPDPQPVPPPAAPRPAPPLEPYPDEEDELDKELTSSLGLSATVGRRIFGFFDDKHDVFLKWVPALVCLVIIGFVVFLIFNREKEAKPADDIRRLMGLPAVSAPDVVEDNSKELETDYDCQKACFKPLERVMVSGLQTSADCDRAKGKLRELHVACWKNCRPRGGKVHGGKDIAVRKHCARLENARKRKDKAGKSLDVCRKQVSQLAEELDGNPSTEKCHQLQRNYKSRVDRSCKLAPLKTDCGWTEFMKRLSETCTAVYCKACKRQVDALLKEVESAGAITRDCPELRSAVAGLEAEGGPCIQKILERNDGKKRPEREAFETLQDKVNKSCSGN
jgi:serine/threonine protein phosphatase PrpC